MALTLKSLVQLDIQGQYVWITDQTGEYDAASNDGGYGTPNPDLNKSALAVVAVYNDETTSNLSAVGTDVLYDSQAVNTDENTFQLNYSLDGWHTVVLFRLPVSNNGTTDLDANSLIEGDFFYYTGTNKVSTLTLGVITEVTDYGDMIDSTQVSQVKCERLFLAKLAIEKKELYWDYKEARNKCGECKETATLFRKLTDLSHDMQGAFSAFWSGLMTSAHDIVVSLMKKHDII